MRHESRENVSGDERNRDAFLLRHFFPEKVERLLEPPALEHKSEDGRLKVSVKFESESGEETGQIWWIYDRVPDGSPRYLSELILDENSAEMTYDSKPVVWTAEVGLDTRASRIDFFTNHRKVVRYQGKQFATYISSPYTRVILRGE